MLLPYAGGLARLQLLYRLPTTPAPRRLLIISDDPRDARIRGGWDGEVTVTTIAGLANMPASKAEFEAIALPGVLGMDLTERRREATHISDAALIALASRFLVAGGVLVGHLHNGRAMRRLLNWRGAFEAAATVFDLDAVPGATACMLALRRAGLTQPECFYVEPNIESPTALIPTNPMAARAHFLRAIRSASDHYSAVGYAGRLLVARLGLGGALQQHLFFWARRPC